MMISLQDKGCHNINFVTPTHMIYAILKSLIIAIDIGLRLPLVYNSGGYDSYETLRLLDGVIDIYMPDFKYSDAHIGYELSSAKDYPEVAVKAITEMHRQVGDLKLDSTGIAYRGLLVRHLVLPNNLAGTDGIIRFIAKLSANTYLNIMDQYRPEYNAWKNPGLKRRINFQEFHEAVDLAKQYGIKRLD